MSQITTHVLDTALGRPAEGIAVALTDATGTVIATGETDGDGRVSALGPDALLPGDYRLEFATGGYLARTGSAAFYPRVTVDFAVTEAAHYHVPLLLSPFGYSTYRGS